MVTVREKRLRNDFQALSELVDRSGGSLQLISSNGNPPYKYIIEYRCRGIEKLQGDRPLFRHTHQVEIYLGNYYPKTPPDAKFLTPIFHPNVWQHQGVCLGSYWTMTETIPELVLRIGKIIQYSKEVLNLKSPANIKASNWAVNNAHFFPVDTQTFKLQMVWQEL